MMPMLTVRGHLVQAAIQLQDDFKSSRRSHELWRLWCEERTLVERHLERMKLLAPDHYPKKRKP